nr:carbamoyltransferase N-terminal domain-containing protein [Kibdelosporangium sp. MJ126-NF4]CEL14728.1 Nodulation protein U [Kibdelosporangium sp. MJ126-NF4]CTQ96642.1 Nodulation protein U (EC 2.1.3.-) [Kibdelosporangium sp. MJ126-NF4]
MLTCGLKLTHDGGIALVEDSRLIVSIELEKVGNNRRYQYVDRWETVEALLATEGVRPSDVDRFVVDGWAPAPDLDKVALRLDHKGARTVIDVAPYQEEPGADPLRRFTFTGIPFGGGEYSSYHHSAQHTAGAYCTSPFAQNGAPALVLVWDGGMPPMLYKVGPAPREVGPAPLSVTSLGSLMPLYGFVFAQFCAHFPVFNVHQTQRDPLAMHASPGNLEVAGKAMAYAALGRDEPAMYPVMRDALAALPFSVESGFQLAAQLDTTRERFWPGSTDADLIATFQGYLGHALLTALRDRLAEAGIREPNLCLAGGCALNIKWNSKLRSSGLFRDIWVPPFPNDSGAALGTAACELISRGGTRLDWTLFSGPDLVASDAGAGWRSDRCDIPELARVLHEDGKPVVVLSGRAELGPRALGHRSILAPATDPAMKDLLNKVKDREPYRPVAPICLEERAPEIFDPGTPDRYMLFDHMVRADWLDRIPAVVHLDGTARLQTVAADDQPQLHRILTEYAKLSGIPVLCNTSANHKGSGFFPDVSSAAEWGRLDAIWSDGVLYRRD